MRDEHAGQVFINPRPPTDRNPLKGPYIPPSSFHEKRAGSTARSHGGHTSPSSKRSQRTQSSMPRSTNTNRTTSISAVSSRRGGTSHTGSSLHQHKVRPSPVIYEAQDGNASIEPASTVAYGAPSGTEVIEFISLRYERYERSLPNSRTPTTNSPAVFIVAGTTTADSAQWSMSYYADHTRMPLLEGRHAEHKELEYTMTDLSKKRQIQDWQDGVVKGSRRM